MIRKITKHLTLLGHRIFPILLLIGLAWGQTTIAVFDLENNGLKDSEAKILTNRLQSELVKVGGYTVVERKKIEKVFEEQKFQMSECVEECLIEIGMLLGAREIVIGSVGRFGSTYTISARLVNATTGEMIRSSDFDSEGDIGILLKSGMFRVASELSGKVMPPQLKDIEAMDVIEKYDSKKGTLYITSIPSSAEIWIDGYKVEGKTPTSIQKLEMGNHTLQLVKNDYELTKTILVKADQINKVNLKLELSQENLNIFSKPGGAFVSVDGMAIKGVTPLTVKDLYIGEHIVKITKENYELYEVQINVEKGKTTQYSANLIKMAKLTLRGNIEGADIYISGAVKKIDTGKSDNHHFYLLKGDYFLKISNYGYLPHEEKFSLSPGEDKIINIELELIKGTIIVDDKYPLGTMVKLYEKSYSKGWVEHLSGNANNNINWKVKPKKYQLRISCLGYATIKKNIQIIGNDKIIISDPLKSNEAVLKEIKSLKMKRNVSFLLAGVITGAGGLIRSLADKQYTDYQLAASNADELRDKIETNDSLALVFFGAGSASMGLPLYYHSKIEKLKQMLSD